MTIYNDKGEWKNSKYPVLEFIHRKESNEIFVYTHISYRKRGGSRTRKPSVIKGETNNEEPLLIAVKEALKSMNRKLRVYLMNWYSRQMASKEEINVRELRAKNSKKFY